MSSSNTHQVRKPAVVPPIKPRKPDLKHWCQRIQETVVSALPEESLGVIISGGADNGQFCWISEIKQDQLTYHSGKLFTEEIILEIQGQKVAGYTLRDATIWLKQVSQNGAPVMIKTVKVGLLPKDLRQFLTARFQKGSVDHDLQQTIRDNLYLRTVPCTTRIPRPGEINGVDYTFLSIEEFNQLEKSGSLLESGIYDGNHYGTPKPPKEPQGQIVRRSSSIGNILPSSNSSSDGKRKRSRGNTDSGSTKSSPVPFQDEHHPVPSRKKSLEQAHNADSLGPLPPNWEMAFTDDGTPYFIDHNTEATHWLDPRLAHLQKRAPEECLDNGKLNDAKSEELPFGWEKVEDPHYGTYFIDHVNRRTQYENPVSQAKRLQGGQGNDITSTLPRTKKNQDSAKRSASESDMNNRGAPPVYKSPAGRERRREPKRVFVKNPAELKGDIIKTSLVKSERGFGFTIIGGEKRDEEFLQVKKVVENGPAHRDGKIKTGDVLVYVDGQCVLGFTHQDIVSSFQGIAIGQSVDLELCRGYPLHPDDPNTEYIVTLAVTLPQRNYNYTDSPPSYSFFQKTQGQMDLSNTSAKNNIKALPDLTRSTNTSSGSPQGSATNISNDDTPDVLSLFPSKPEMHKIDIVRGEMGFGFTIADSAYGQRVKQILDKPRCKTLQEGDLLQEINNINVRDMSHSQIVGVLKECPKGIETTIVVQRGGLPAKGKKSARSSPVRSLEGQSNAHSDTSFGSNQPGAYFFKENHDNQNTDNKDHIDAPPVRPKTPTKPDIVRPKTPSNENRPKTPTKNIAMINDSRGKPAVSRPPFLEMQNNRLASDSHLLKRDHHDEAGSQDLNQSRTSSEFFNSHSVSFDSSRPPPGPRSDHRNFNRQHNQVNQNHSMQNYHDRDHDPRFEYSRGDTKPGMFRSRTPGPEMMGRGPDYKPEFHRPKTPTANDMRSKTPIPGFGYAPGGNSDFLGTRYMNGPSRHGYGGPQRSWGQHSNDYPGSPPPLRRPENLDSFDRNNVNSSNNFIQGGAGRPSRQSTSFEDVEPIPSNITRVPKRFPLHSNSSFNSQFSVGNQSPRLPARIPDREDSIRLMELHVTLYRQDSGFGFRIIGGTEEGSQVSVGHIVPGGAADVDGTLRTGDEITHVDGVCVINSSHHRVVQFMSNSSLNGRVNLTVRRRVLSTGETQYPGTPFDSIYPYEVTVTREESEGFGFVIISSVTKSGSTIDRCSVVSDWLDRKNLYPWIGRILENSPAERCGRLHVGDRILAVNGVDISHMHHEDIVNLIKDAGYSVSLTVGPPQDDTSSNASTSQRSSQGSMVNAMAYPTQGEGDVRRFPPPPLPPDRIKDRQRFPNHQGPEEDEYYTVELPRGARGFGFSIRGGKEFNNMPLFVLRIAEGGSADLDGRLRVGDHILEINGYNTDSITHSDAIDIIQNGGPTVQMLVKRTGKPPPIFEGNGAGMRYGGLPVSNGPIGQSSPYLGRRNIPAAEPRNDQYFYNYQSGRQYTNY